MVAVIGQMIACAWMRKDDQPVPIKRGPGQKRRKLRGCRTQLAGIHRMRADRAGMHMPHRHVERIACGLTKAAGLVDGLIVKIDVDVIVGDRICLFHAP